MKPTLQIEDLTVETNPFAHAVAGPLFTDTSFNKLITHIPPQHVYSRDTYQPDGERYEYWPLLHLRELNHDDAEFWIDMQNLFRSKDTIEMLFSPFKDFFWSDTTLKRYWNEGTPQPLLRLVREVCPYNFLPHLDMVSKILVLVIYLNISNDAGLEGTILYRKNEDDFIPIKTVPYKANTALITPRTKHSWHGGNWTKAGIRDTLHVYYFPPSFKNYTGRQKLYT